MTRFIASNNLRRLARPATAGARGFAMIELLVVLVVIAILMGGYFGHGKEGSPEQGTYKLSMDRSNNAACLLNRASLRTNIEMFKMSHPKEEVTTENLQKAGFSVPTCPQGGTYGFLPDGSIVCTKHPDKKPGTP